MAMYVGIIYKYATLFDLLVQKGPMSVQLGHFRARVACSSRPLLSKGSGMGGQRISYGVTGFRGLGCGLQGLNRESVCLGHRHLWFRKRGL